MSEIELEGLIIEWDDTKAEINRKKHNVTFEMAARVFLDQNLIDDFDELHSDDEDRIKVIDMVAKVLVVILLNAAKNIVLSRLDWRIKRRLTNIIGSLIIKHGMKLDFTPEQLEEIKRWEEMTDEDIDYSDIPPLTDEELAGMKPARLRKRKFQNIAG